MKDYKKDYKLGLVGRGEVKDTDWHYGKIVKGVSRKVNDIIDLEQYILEPKDQGETGFCHSYSATAMKEAQEYIELGYKQELSPLYMARTVKALDGDTSNEGTTLPYVAKVLIDTGVIKEEYYPSNDYVVGSFKFPLGLANEATLPHYKCKNYAYCDTVEEIEQALNDGKFVLLGIQVTRQWADLNNNASDTITFDANGKMLIVGGHLVLCYKDDAEKDCFKIRNSWGKEWGDNGSAYLPKDYLRFKTKDSGFSLFIGALSFIDLENDPLIGTKIELTIGSKDVLVDGNTTTIDVAPYIDTKSNRCLVPVRFLSECLGYKVEWNDTSKRVAIKNDKHTIYLWIGKDYAIVDGYKKTLDQMPVIKDERTFVPIRLIAEAFGCTVLWDNRLCKITILTTDIEI